MKFSRLRGAFMLTSLTAIIVLYAVTFGYYDGFAHSITFNGGIRFSLNPPPGVTKESLEKGLARSGLTDYQVRLANVRTNTFDIEFGPRIQETVRDQIRKHNKTVPGPGAAPQGQGDQGKRGGQPVAKGGPQKKGTVVGEIEKLMLSKMPFLTSASIISREAISASYGGNLARIAVWSLLLVIGIIGIYLSFRFDFPFAIGASLALLHDVVVVVGCIGVLRIEPDIPIVAAVLMIVGYSINDTIVIFDRIRETMDERSYSGQERIMDLAITQTLSRTVVTSVLTLLAVLALLFGGAESLYNFALILTIGVVVGTYSSIFIAAHFVQYYQLIRDYFR